MAAILAAATAGSSTSALAQTSSATSNPFDGRFYFELNGSYQSVALPAFDLGWRYITLVAPFPDRGPAIVYDPRVSGGGASGAVGYILPHGTMPAAFGSNARVELDWSYVHAEATQSGSSAATSSAMGSGFRVNSVDGTFTAAFLCVVACHARSTLESKYESLRFDLKMAGDYRAGQLTLTPSLSVIGGWTRSRQTMSAQMVFDPPADRFRYSASAKMNWTDWGAKVGLDATVPATSWLAVGLGGSVGTAHRAVVTSANDSFIDNPLVLSHQGKTEDRDTTTPVLANAEARLVVQAWQNVGIRAFAGLNYDSRVPGVAASCPACVGSTGTVSGAPASIKFQSATSYYVGGGFVLKFDP